MLCAKAPKIKSPSTEKVEGQRIMIGWGGVIRTHDPLLPMQIKPLTGFRSRVKTEFLLHSEVTGLLLPVVLDSSTPAELRAIGGLECI
jgi:hypothetical protein